LPLLPVLLPALLIALAEPLPLSVEAHLTLLDFLGGPPRLTGLDLFAVLAGIFLATAFYLARDLWRLMLGIAQAVRGRARPERRLLANFLLATLPSVALLALDPTLLAPDATAAAIGWATLAGAVLLLLADRLAMTIRRVEHMRIADALTFGLCQLVAAFPGVSRMGATMTAGRILGLERGEATRFALLLSLPALAGGLAILGYDLYDSGSLGFELRALLLGLVAFLVALSAIAWLFRWVARRSLTAFAVYRLLLGLFLLAVAYQPWRR
jgi:undecaprenyl-diphosphatase